MALLWIWIWLTLPDQVLLSGPDHCGGHESSSSPNGSPLLQSLQCYNDYKSHVDCKWKAPTNMTVHLWLKEDEDGSRKLCVPLRSENATEDGVVKCRYETPLFAMSVNHTMFFVNNQTASLCSSSKHISKDLVQHLRARPPENLTVSEESDGSHLLRWSSPYPPSSSLSQNLTYEVSFRTQDGDAWNNQEVENTSMKLERQRLLPGRRYEAKVRTRAALGRWSEWTPVVIWKTGDDIGHVPPLDCVLLGEKRVMCSWEVSRELAYLITYRLTCRHNQTARFKTCCTKPAVSSDARGNEVRYSCPLTDVDPERLQLRLRPTHNTKTFTLHKNIQPDSPEQVKVQEENGDWVVEWSAPAGTPLNLLYQVWYYSTKYRGSSVQLNISEGSTSVTILGTSLIPLQAYEVKVRSLVAPGSGSTLEGIPSEWSAPANWTSNEATWSVSKLIYCFIGVLAVVVFLTLYNAIPVCRRKLESWVNSVPSPGKSKMLSEIKSPPWLTFVQSEKTSCSNIQYLDSLSTCSSDALLWPTKNTEKMCADQNRSCWNYDNLPSPADNGLDASSMSFSGPYIVCQASGSMLIKFQQEEVNETSPNEAAPCFPAPCPLYDKDYVCLPNRALSRSTEDLTSHSSSGPVWYNIPEQDQHHLNATPQPVSSENTSNFKEPTMNNQLSEYTPGPLPSWPQEGTKSGYCQLPSSFTAA